MSHDRSSAPERPATRPGFIDARRRGLLQGAAAVVAGAATGAGAAVGADHEAVAAPAPEIKADAGYRVTEHVREYYAKARF